MHNKKAEPAGSAFLLLSAVPGLEKAEPQG